MALNTFGVQGLVHDLRDGSLEGGVGLNFLQCHSALLGLLSNFAFAQKEAFWDEDSGIDAENARESETTTRAARKTPTYGSGSFV